MVTELGLAATSLMAYLENPAVTIVAHLGKNPIPLDRAQVLLTDLVECNFPGYAPVVITDWECVESEGDDYGEALSPDLAFVAAGSFVAQNIYSVYVTITEGTNAPILLQCNLLNVPFVIDTDKQEYQARVRIANAEIPAE